MKTITRPQNTILTAGLCSLALLLSLPASAVNVTKLDTTSMAADTSNWSAAPGTNDVGEFNGTPSSTTLANLTLGGSDLTLGGLQLDGTLTGPLTIASGNTLTLGMSGINMSAANNSLTMNCNLTLGSGYQAWTVASGKTLAINGTLGRAAGASMSFPTTGVTSTTLANDATGILGGWATVTGTSDWATNSSATGVGIYTGYTSVSGSTTGAGASAQNWKNSGGTVTLTASATINSLNQQNDFTVNSGVTLTLGSGGLIFGSTERWFLGSSGFIKSGLASGELYIHANTTGYINGWNIQPQIIDGSVATAVIKDGPGQALFSNGNNNYTGGTYVNAGTVYLGAGSTGSGNSVTKGPLGTAVVTLNGGGLNLHNQTLGNNINIPAGASATINNGGGTGILNGNIGGVVPTFLGAGLTVLQGANTYSGNTTITVGTLGVGNAAGTDNNLSTGDVIVTNGGTLRVGYAVTSNQNKTYTPNNITLGGGTLYEDDAFQHLTGNINVTAASTLGSTYNGGGGDADKGLYVDGLVSGSSNLTVQHSRYDATHTYDTSYVVFTNNANTYSGTITVNENTASTNGGVYLGVNGSTALANATINVPAAIPGTVLRFGTSPVVFHSGLGSATLGALTGSGPVVLAGYDPVSYAYAGTMAVTVGANNSSTNYSGVLSGGGSLIKAGSGTFTLTGTNTYTGSTTVSAGSLTIGGAGQLGSGYYSGAIINNASLNYSSSAAQALAGPISGSGTLTIAGGSTLAVGGLQSSSQNNVTVNDGATLIEAFTPAAQLTPTSLTVGNTTGATLGFVINRTSPAPLAPGTLTLNGTDTINILGGNLVAGNSYPLIAYTTKTGSGSFALTVPTGVAGYLSTSVNTIYFNVTGITNTIWTGAVNGTWDINTTANWTNAGTLGNTYIDGSLVQFDDTGLITTITNVSGTLSPLSVNVTNTAKNYTIKTVVGGYGGLTKTGTGSLTNTAANTYAGPTTISQGQVVAGVTSVANVSGAVGNNSAVTLGNDATAALNLNNNATQIGSLTGGGTTGGNVVLGSGTLTVGGDNTSPAAYGGVISGSGGLTKIGTGTLTLSGTNVYSGTTLIAQGKVVVNGNGTLGAPGAGFIRVGNTTGQAGAMYQSGVNTVVSNSTAGSFIIASAAGAYGYYNLASGTINSLIEIDPANGGVGDFGQFDMSGGTINLSSANPYFLPARTGSGESSVVNISGGTIQIAGGATPADGSFNGYAVNWGNTGAAADTNTTTISGSGQLLFPSLRTKLNVGSSYNGVSGNSANVCALNLNGGVFQTLGFLNGAANNPNVNINFNGGTLKAGTAANAAYMSGLGGVYLYGNGGTFDNNGLAIAIAQTFSSPTGSGVSSVAVGTAGSGYIVPPQVTITGSGTGATAYSTIDPVSGAVTGIIVTCPGMNYSSPTVTLAGGGGSGATAGTVSLAANTSGPMTFTGAGITTLSNAYYVTGGLNVTGGTLVMNTANGTPSPAGDLTVSNATLTLDATSGTPLPANNFSGRAGSTINLTLNPNANGINATAGLYLGTNLTLNLNYNGGATLTANPLAAALNATGSLTKGTNIVINISASGLSVGVFPLITTGAAVTTNNFTLGTLPPGIKAVLTNNTANSLDLLVYGAGQLLSWHGANIDNSVVLTNWDINTSTNWYDINYNLTKYLQYSGNSYGDNVTFGDSGYNVIDGTNHVYLPANVVPATVTFSASSPYHLTGPGGIGGTTSLLLTNGSGAVYLETSNSYTGGTIVGSGALVITNDNALGNASVGVTLAGGTLQLNSPITSSRSVAVTGNSMLGVPTNVTAQLNGALSGTNALTKTDNGTLTLAGSSGSVGALLVGAGTLNVNGTVSDLETTVGSAAGNALMNLSGNLLVASNLFVGNVSGAVAGVQQTSGTVTLTNVLGDTLNVGNVAGSFGYYNAAGGTLNVDGISIGGENFPANWPPAGNNAYGIFEVHGATVNNSGWIVLARGGANDIGVLNMFTGSLTYGGVGSIGCNWELTGSDQTSIINIMGGSVTSTNQGVNFRTVNTGVLNLNGGLLSGTSVTGPGIVNFNGGTLQANANSSGFVSVTSANVYGNGGTIDDNGYTITANQPLLAPVGYGVSTIAVSGDSSGYVVPPIVTISGGAGSNATAIATISGGQVTGITVTSPGNGYGSGDGSVMSLTFTGGGAGATPPSTPTFTLIPNTSGGLIKKGSGIVILTGTNTYTGLTLVTNGTLLFGPVPQAGNQVVVANGAKFGVVSTSMSNSATIGALTLGNGSGAATLDFTYGFVGNPTNVTLIAGAVTNNGSTTIQIGGAFALGTFPVMQYSSLSGSFNSTVSAPRGMGASVSNDTVNKIIYVVVNSLASPIVWTGTNPNPGKTNLWDLNTTTNWLSGVDPTTYQEVLPPGDAVLFNDSGTGLVLLSNTASPLSVTISNNSTAYTFQGSGKLSGTTGLTKQGTGTATLSLAGDNYTGPTTIAGGTLVDGSGSGISASSAVTLSNVVGAALNVTATETIGSLAGGGAAGGNVAYSGDLTVGANNGSTTYGGAVNGTGRFIVNGAGSLTVTGSVTAGNEVWVGGVSSTNTPTLNIQPGATIINSNWFVIGRDGSTGIMNINGGTLVHAGTGNLSLASLGTNPHGTLNLNSGSISNLVGETYVGEGSSAITYGFYNQAGGVANLGNFYVGHNQSGGTLNNAVKSIGAVTVTGGILNAGNFYVGYGDNQGQGIGTATLSGCTLNAGNIDIGYGYNNTRTGTNVVTIGAGATVNASGFVRLAYAGSSSLIGILTNSGTLNVGATALYLSYWPDGCSGHVTMNAGAINLQNNASIIFALNGAQVSVNDFTQNGGAVTFYSDAGITVGGTGVLNLGNSGSANDTYTLAGGTLTVPQITKPNGTGTFNFNGGTLKAATSSTTFMQGLSAANVMTGGAIIDTTNNSITITQVLRNDGVDEDGGLTKSGNGTLILNGVNTYTNVTKIGAGTLGGTGTIAGGVVVSNAASLAPGAGIGTLTINGNLTLNAGSTNVFEVNGTTPANDKVVAGGAVNYGGVLSIVPTGAFIPGQQFQLFSGTGATNASNFASITGSPGAGMVFSFTNGMLSVVSTGPTLTSVTPNPVAGSTYPVMLSLTGSGFTGASAVLLTNVTASAGASYVPTINSDTSISVSFVPGTTVSTWNATVVNGSPSAQVGFTVSVPPAVKIGSGVGLAGTGKLVLSGTNGTPGYSYVVLSTTNLNPPVVWTPVVTNTFDGSGNFAYTNTVSTVTNKLFLRIQQ